MLEEPHAKHRTAPDTEIQKRRLQDPGGRTVKMRNRPRGQLNTSTCYVVILDTLILENILAFSFPIGASLKLLFHFF